MGMRMEEREHFFSERFAFFFFFYFIIQFCLLLTFLGIQRIQSQEEDECAGLFFTPAWHECLMRKIYSNWQNSGVFMDPYKFTIPTIPPVKIPNVDEIIKQAQEQVKGAQEQAQAQVNFAKENAQTHVAQVNTEGFPGMSSFSSNSFSASSGSGGTSNQVLSSNGRTWIIESEGLPTSSTSDNAMRHLKIIIGNPESVVKTYGADNSFKIVATYADGSMKWLKLTLNSPTLVGDLKVNTINGIMYVEGNM